MRSASRSSSTRTVGKDVQLTDLLDEYDAVYIGAGCMLSNPLTDPYNKEVPGARSLGVLPGLPFLEKVNFGEPVFVGKRVAVLGGGFTAMDCCRSSIRFGAEKVYVALSPLEGRDALRRVRGGRGDARARRVHLSRLDRSRCSAMTASMSAASKMIRNRLGDPDASGRRKAVPVPGSEFVLDVDTVISAFGQYADTSWIPAQELGLEVNR